MREALLLVAIAGWALAQPAPHGYIGVGGCASSICHGATTALTAGESRILGNEYAHWSVSDKHARAFKALVEARGKRMAELLGIADATRDRRCTACHIAGSPEKTRSDGVACEACHGPAEHWLGTHTRQNSHEASVKAGMIDTKNLEIRAKTCLACHLGAPGQEVDHELIAAGHPDLAFELDTFTAAQPAHHRPAAPAMRQRAWAVGQAVALAESMRLLQTHAEKSWPEFSDLECYQCHHDLRAESWRIQRGYPGRKPGSVQVNAARIEMVRALVAALAPEERTALESAAARLNPPATVASAKAIEHIADTLATRFQKQDIDAAAVLRAVTANIQRIADDGVSAAEQATMTLDALGTKPDATAPLYTYLEHPSLYRPSEFAALFQKSRRNAMRACERMRRVTETLWGSLVSCGRLSIGPMPRSHAACGGNQPPRRFSTCPTTLVILILIALPICAQRAQLGRQGRQPESGRPEPAEPIRKLPRRNVPNLPVVPAPLRPEQSARPLSEDRVHPLLRGAITPLAAEMGQGSPHALPRRPGALTEIEAAMPSVQTTAIPNRWQIFPALQSRRYEDKRLAAIYTTSRLLDPYNRNTYKGDYPLVGRRLFFAVTAVSESTAESRRIPVPSVASSTDPGEFGFFGRGEQSLFQQNFRFGFDIYRGSAGFEPVDLEFRITPEFNINYAVARENGLLAIDVRPGTHRTDTAIGVQEMFVEKRLFTGKAFFDFTSVRVGIQRFTSDFRGLIFSDEQPGARLFGNFHNNVFQYNLAYFNLLEKDANSGLNHWQSRRQQVYAANLYWSDFLTKGYTLNFSALYNHDQPSFLVDKNGFLIRPAPVGFPVPHKVRAGYAGISGEGHIKRINVSHAFYQAFGRDDFNPIPAQKNPQHINAQLAFAEAGYEKDWMEWKASIFYTSGDKKLNDGRANGFDGIVPNQQIAGGGFLGNPALADRGLLNNAFAAGGTNFLNREPVPLTGTGLFLFGPNSLMPTMRPGLFEGQANFVNPGILLFNAAFNAKVTPKLRASINANWAKFNRTEVLEALLFQSHIRHAVGLDTGVGVQYRPLLTDNIVITGGVGTLIPGGGFKDIYTGRTLFSAFVNVRMVF